MLFWWENTGRVSRTCTVWFDLVHKYTLSWTEGYSITNCFPPPILAHTSTSYCSQCTVRSRIVVRHWWLHYCCTVERASSRVKHNIITTRMGRTCSATKYSRAIGRVNKNGEPLACLHMLLVFTVHVLLHFDDDLFDPESPNHNVYAKNIPSSSTRQLEYRYLCKPIWKLIKT